MNQTVNDAFSRAARAAPDQTFLIVPPSATEDYTAGGVTLSYNDAWEKITDLGELYAASGYGHGHRVALLLENRSAFFVHWLALNALGVSVVPINPHFRQDEMVFLIAHSDASLIVALDDRVADVAAVAGVPVIAEASKKIPTAPWPAPNSELPGSDSECALLYTSGTTGTPKGCRLSNEYFRMMGDWYLGQGGLCAVRPGRENILSPLPLFHMNAMACSFMAAVLSRNTLVQLDRFHPATWWSDVRATGATIIHYLGVMPAILLGLGPAADDRGHAVRFGFGANVEPAQHAAFEARFGFPLIEGWAMTETGAGAVIAASHEPRHVGTRCIGRPQGCEIRVVDESGDDAAPGVAGELLVRHAGSDPRAGFFSGYHKDQKSTEAAWRNGWFNTGDIVRRGEDGSIHFVDRARNIIRRSGENIAALEVEELLLAHPGVEQCAVIAVPDDVRGEEVAACIVTSADAAKTAETANSICRFCLDRLAYFKAPGWIYFVDALPATATNKVRKRDLAELIGDTKVASFDCRPLKGTRRTPSSSAARPKT